MQVVLTFLVSVVVPVYVLASSIGSKEPFCPGDDTRYVRHITEEGGYCEQCPKCDGGGFFKDKTKDRVFDEKHGFISCWPCEQCPTGKYREAGSASETCNYCNKNCSKVFRRESMACGGSSPGHCGQCFPGREAEDDMPESYCKKERDDKDTVPITTKTLQMNTTPSIEGSGTGTTERRTKGVDSAGAAIICATVVLICIALFAGIFYFHKNKLRCCNATDATQFGSQESKRPLKSDCSLETDGPGSPNPELMSRQSDFGPQALIVHQQHTGYMRERSDCKLDVQDQFTKDCLIVVSNKATNEYKRNTIFKCLGIATSVYEPEEERFLKEKQSPYDFIYNVLKRWTQSDTDPTFLRLYDAVRTAGYPDIGKELQDTFHRQDRVRVVSSERNQDEELVPYSNTPKMSGTTTQFSSIEIQEPGTVSPTGPDAQYVSSDESLILKI